MKMAAVIVLAFLVAGCTVQGKRHDILYCVGACILLQAEDPKAQGPLIPGTPVL